MRMRPSPVPLSFPLVNSASPQIGPQRSRARSGEAKPIDGEDRSGIIQGEGKGGGCRRDWTNGLLALVNQAARHFRNIFAAAILALRP